MLYFLLGDQLEELARDVASTTSTAALGFLVRGTLWLVILLMILDNFGVNITALVASLGGGALPWRWRRKIFSATCFRRCRSCSTSHLSLATS